MDEFRELVNTICQRPGMYVGWSDFDRVALFLNGCDFAWDHQRPDFRDAGFNGFRQWLAVRLDSCVRTDWPAIIRNEDTGPDKLAALKRLYGEFSEDRDARGIDAILADFEQLEETVWAGLRNRTCWCERIDSGDAGKATGPQS